MASHDYHPGLADYKEGRVLQDGCGECEQRSRDLEAFIAHTDHEHWLTACKRALAMEWGRPLDPPVGEAEARVFRPIARILIKTSDMTMLLKGLR